MHASTLLVALSALALPTLFVNAASCPINPQSSSPPAQCDPADPPYTQKETAMFQNINCSTVAGGIQGVKRSPILLVPGTGSNGVEAWANGGYLDALPSLGHDVCILNEPDEMCGDAQDVDERIAYAINTLSTISGQKIIALGWSQGNLDIQWVLTFWKSSLANTDRFISLAGDFKGTALSSILDGFGAALNGTNLRRRREVKLYERANERRDFPIPLPASVHQQVTPSNYLKALAAHGGLEGKVPTTSIFSSNDEIISPENDSTNATSYLEPTADGPVGNILIQNYCQGYYTHGDELFLNTIYQIVLLALSSPTRYASPAQVRAANVPCSNTQAGPGFDPQKGNKAIVGAGINILTRALLSSPFEPPVRPYAAAGSPSLLGALGL